LSDSALYCRVLVVVPLFFHRKGGRTSSSSFFFSLGSFREIEDAERLLRGVSRFHQLPLFSPSSSSVCAKAITIIASKLL
jgi:hypothetical protein